MKIVIPEPLKKGLLLVLLGLGMQTAQLQCMNQQPTPEQLWQQIQFVASDKALLKQKLSLIGVQEPQLTPLTNQFFQKPDKFKQWLDQLDSEQGDQQTQRRTVVQKRELNKAELVAEFNKILNFAQKPREFSLFLKEQSGNVFIGYLSNEAIATQKTELERRFAFYSFLKPAAFSFGALSVVLAGVAWLKWFNTLDKSTGIAPSTISKSALLDRITQLESQQKFLVQAGAITVPVVAPAQSQSGGVGTWVKGAVGLMSLGAISLAKCAFSDIGMQVLTSWGLTPSAWLMRHYPFGELFSSVPSLNWVLENQTEFMAHAEMVRCLFRTDVLFSEDAPQSMLEYMKTFLGDKKKPKKNLDTEKNGFLAPFEKHFKEAIQQRQASVLEKIKPLVEAFARTKEQYCHKEQGVIVELAHNVSLFMNDIEKILGYMNCRMSVLAPTSKTYRLFVAAYQALYRLSNNFVYSLRQAEFDEAFVDFLKINEHLALCKTIFR